MVWFSSPKQLQHPRTSGKQLCLLFVMYCYLMPQNLSAGLVELQKANWIPVCIRQSISSRSREVIYLELDHLS